MRNPGDAYYLVAGKIRRLQDSCNPFLSDLLKVSCRWQECMQVWQIGVDTFIHSEYHPYNRQLFCLRAICFRLRKNIFRLREK